MEAVPLTDDLFDNDSHAMVNLRTSHVSIVEKDTGRSVICDVSDFPYTLIWSAAKKPLHFVCIEPSLGCDRVALAFLCEAYDEQHMVDAKGKEDMRTVLHLHPFLAPFKCAVLPLSKKLGDKAMEIRNELAKDFMVDYDDAGSIGKRYRRQDEIGTPLCITVDFQTVGDDKVEADGCVTVRDRDTMEQIRMPISELRDYIAKKVAF